MTAVLIVAALVVLSGFTCWSWCHLDEDVDR